MPASCSRVDCNEPAVAVFGFDAAAALVWLDPYEGRVRGAGLLCARHADTITPLRGWTLVDRRARAPRLWAERPRVVTPARPRGRRAHRRFHGVGETAADATPLPFAERNTSDDALVVEVSPSEDALAVDVESAPVTERRELDELLTARSPMLARAFQSARPRPVGS
jgi:hypothetical protein